MSGLEIIAGIAGSALVTFFVYRYRSVIVFDLISLNQPFKIDGTRVLKSTGFHKYYFSLQQLELVNRGWRNLQNVRLHLEHRPKLFDSTVSSTRSVGKATVRIVNKIDDVIVEIDELPRNEKIVIQLSYLEYNTRFCSLKGASGTYKLIERDEWENDRKIVLTMGYFLTVLIFVFLLLFSSIS